MIFNILQWLTNGHNVNIISTIIRHIQMSKGKEITINNLQI